MVGSLLWFNVLIVEKDDFLLQIPDTVMFKFYKYLVPFFSVNIENIFPPRFRIYSKIIFFFINLKI